MNMKHFFAFFLKLFILIPVFTNAETVTKTDSTNQTAYYLSDLENFGFCIIPNIFSNEETLKLYERVFHEFIEKAWPNCKLNDRSNWNKTFPIHMGRAIFAGPAGQTQVMWDLRQDPRIVDVFANVWNTGDLIVSMDGLSIMCPQEIREGKIDPWPHVDQTTLTRQDGVSHNNRPPIDFISESLLKTKPYTVQGMFLFEDSFEGDGGFYCIPKSHLRFEEFAPVIETLNEQSSKKAQEYLLNFFSINLDDSNCPYEKKHITAPRGSLILWDSRTVHWNQHADINKKSSDQPKVRMVGYLCYVPKSRLSEEGKILRKEAFKKGVATGHNPAYPELKYTIDHIKPQYKEYLEDETYIQAKINLTPLGQSLLGF